MYSNAYTDVVLKLPTIPPRYRFASAMAPKGLKQTPICKLGRVQQTQSSQWRARAWLDGRNVCGPHRSQETEAQADLQLARATSSRMDMADLLDRLKHEAKIARGRAVGEVRNLEDSCAEDARIQNLSEQNAANENDLAAKAEDARKFQNLRAKNEQLAAKEKKLVDELAAKEKELAELQLERHDDRARIAELELELHHEFEVRREKERENRKLRKRIHELDKPTSSGYRC